MKVKRIPLDSFVEINPEGITKSYPHDHIEYVDISSVGTGYMIEPPKPLKLSEAPSRAKRIIRNGDTILATVRPNLRSFLYVTQAESNTIASTGFAVLRANRNAAPRFVYYAVTDTRFTDYLTKNTKGTSYPAVDSNTILRGEVPQFPLGQQHRIVEVLSAYDNMIKNNRRRIQLLEQAARLLYREWFVHLRFPGHEHTRIIDGVPEGWEKKSLGTIAPLKYGKALKKDDRTPGPIPVYGSSGIVGSHIKALLSGPALIVGRKGNVGSVYWSASDCHPIDTVYYIDSGACTLFLYYSLQHMNFISTDVAVPGLNRDFAHSRFLLVADQKILRLFEETVLPIHQQMEVLKRQNASLTKARDLLLPKLMNGEVAV